MPQTVQSTAGNIIASPVLQSDVGLFYKFCPLLIQYVPKKTVQALIAQKSRLDPKMLIPALVQYDHTRFPNQVASNLLCATLAQHVVVLYVW